MFVLLTLRHKQKIAAKIQKKEHIGKKILLIFLKKVTFLGKVCVVDKKSVPLHENSNHQVL